MLKQFLTYFRRLLGTEQILQRQWQQEQKQQELQSLLLALGNAQSSFHREPAKVRGSVTYQRCREIILLLSPREVSGKGLIRVGKDHDGGYVMLDGFSGETTDAAYSFGLSDDVSWDAAIAARGIDVFMHDHTIEQPSQCHARFHFFKTGVTGFVKGTNLRTLKELISQNGHGACHNLILKMDVEGCEWDVFEETSPETLAQFSQIVLELHALTSIHSPVQYGRILHGLKKLHQTHQSVHVHANGNGIPLWIGDLTLPDVLEVTLVRRSDFKEQFTANERQFPTGIDQPTFSNSPEILLGDFSPGEEKGG